MLENATLAEIGALVGDPGRASMLVALLDGRALTATELASHAGVARPTASGHLARLVAAGLVVMRRQGRHRYHSLASAEVARMLESMMELAASTGSSALVRVGPNDAALRAARTCYDHLAGRLAVRLADAMQGRKLLRIDGGGGRVTREGRVFFRDLGLDLDAAFRSRRAFCRTCVDWSERRLHLAGALGAALLERCFELRWLRRRPGTRALAVTAGGQEGFRREFGIDP